MLADTSPPAPATPPVMSVDIAETLAANLSFKVLIIDAIVGVGFPTYLLATECERAGLAIYSQHHPDMYVWNRNALARNPIEKLQELYQGLCEARDDALKGIGAAGGVTEHAG